MSQFTVNKDMFGRYCHIPTDTGGNMHIYKIVSQIESNVYCEVPLVVNSKETIHKNIVPVLLVIHCGIDETNVRKVALSDCKIIADNEPEVIHGKQIYDMGSYLCSECDYPMEHKVNYCPHCGVKMDR